MTVGAVVIVTGAAGGIGASTVRALARRGARVIAVDIDGPGAEATASRCREDGAEVEAYSGDTSDAAVARGMVERAMDRWGRLDGVFNNAATIGPIRMLDDYDEEQFDRVMRVNVRSVWLGTKHALPALRRSGGGAIVNTASGAGVMAWPRLTGYVTSKHAVVGLTRAVAVETAHEGIRVNALLPGPTETRILQTIGDEVAPGDERTARRLQEATVPAARLASPDEIAEVAVWLLLDAPPYLTGALVPVDGAQTAGFGLGQTTS